ncbi:porin family protein [Flavobacterium sp.]|uniref:porin family protein n=1 Tax=Flavobacterium sp. TaxID=239 RepID=UPI0039E5D588
MKKNFFALAALAVFGVSQAQQFKFGPKAGLNISTLVGGDASDDNKMLIGYHVGGVAEIKFGRFALQPEIQYSRQGTQTDGGLKFGSGELTYDSKTRMDYLNLLIMARFYAFKGFSIEAGPQAGILLSAETEYKNTNKATQKRDVKHYYDSTDFGINAGFGYDFSNGIFTGLRYTMGVLSISEDMDFDVRSSVIGIYGGFKF